MIRVGPMASGYRGPNPARDFVEISTIAVVGAADLDQERPKDIQESYREIMVAKDYRDPYRLGLDAIVIGTRAAAHFDLARAVLLRCLRNPDTWG